MTAPGRPVLRPGFYQDLDKLYRVTTWTKTCEDRMTNYSNTSELCVWGHHAAVHLRDKRPPRGKASAGDVSRPCREDGWMGG